MFLALAKDLGLFGDGHALMLTGEFRAVVVHIALWTEIRLFSNTIELGQFRRHLGTILTIGRLGDQLLMGINREIHQIHREHLIILIHHILVLVELDVFLLVI